MINRLGRRPQIGGGAVFPTKSAFSHVVYGVGKQVAKDVSARFNGLMMTGFSHSKRTEPTL